MTYINDYLDHVCQDEKVHLTVKERDYLIEQIKFYISQLVIIRKYAKEENNNG